MARKREERKRGRKKSHRGPDDDVLANEKPDLAQENEDGEAQQPSWMLEQATTMSRKDQQDSTPFGLVEADLKAYMRSVQTTLQNLPQLRSGEDAEYVEIKAEAEKEATKLRNAALDEARGHELELATDQDTSIVMELLISRMASRQVRILADGLMGNVFTLSNHRFGSHVLQATLSALQAVAAEEENEEKNESKANSTAQAEGSSKGILRTARELIREMTEELLPSVSDMLPHPFATHSLRSLLLVLMGRQASPSDSTSLRSKRSAKFRARGLTNEISNAPLLVVDLPSYQDGLDSILQAAKVGMDTSEIKAMSISPASSPTLALFLELDQLSGELLDLTLDGLVSLSGDESDKLPERSAHIETLLRDQVGSHLLEKALQLCPLTTLELFWKVYIQGRVCKLGTHPVANFVVASAAKRLPGLGQSRLPSDDILGEALDEVRQAGDSLVKNGRIGIIHSLVRRASKVVSAISPAETTSNETKKKIINLVDDDSYETQAVRAVLGAFGFAPSTEQEEMLLFLPAVLSLKTQKGWRKAVRRTKEEGKKGSERKRGGKRKHGGSSGDKVEARKDENDSEDDENEKLSVQKGKEEGKEIEKGEKTKRETLDVAEPQMQGSLLLQAMARLSTPANEVVFESILAQQDLTPLSRSSIGVHILLTCLGSETATFKQRKALILKLLARIQDLADDRFGSRVADALWERCDGFMKERLASSCLQHERFLVGSPYGRFFVRKLNLGLYRKNVIHWKEWLKTNGPAMPAAIPRLGEEAEDADQMLLGLAETSGTRPDAAGEFDARRKKRRRLSKVDEQLDDILAGVR